MEGKEEGLIRKKNGVLELLFGHLLWAFMQEKYCSPVHTVAWKFSVVLKGNILIVDRDHRF